MKTDLTARLEMLPVLACLLLVGSAAAVGGRPTPGQ